MKIKPYIEKLEKSKEFKKLKTKNPDAFMVAGFFVMDLETGNNVHQIDYYVPEQKKFAAFTLDGNVSLQLVDALKDNVPEKLEGKINIDLDILKDILLDEMHNRGISEDIRKIIAIVQNVKGKKVWNLNCVLTGMGILKSHIDDESKTVLKIEKNSLADIMKKVPVQEMQEMAAPKTKDGIKKELEKLDSLETEIEKEKTKLKGKLNKFGVSKGD
ncbi:hypothetical protein HY450_03490 [Candidatus Pacearchaeota archaeon]|nr:hypothetical protein [Candidatus Pacearchaeota archaeon]